MRTAIQRKISHVPLGKSNWTEIPGNTFSSFSEIWVYLMRLSPFPKIPGMQIVIFRGIESASNFHHERNNRSHSGIVYGACSYRFNYIFVSLQMELP